MYAFRGLRDERLVALGRQLERETRPDGDRVCAEGHGGEYFYIVDRGQVRLSRVGADRAQTLEPGDFFGAEAILTGRHPYSAEALGEVQLLRLASADLQELLASEPTVAAGLHLAAETRGQLFGARWDWLGPGENVTLILRRHIWLLWQQMLPPVAAAVAAVLAAGALAVFWAPAAGVWAAGLLVLPALAWAAWVYADWGNDFYIVTNQRVVYLEKVVMLYDSRTTVALNALTAVGAGSENFADRLLDYGDVTVKTLSRPLVLRAIPYPQFVAALISEQLGRTQTRTRSAEAESLRAAIRDRIAPTLPQPRAEQPVGEAAPGPAAPLFARTPTAQPAEPGFFSLQLRFDQGDTIVYRKHWWLLVRALWVQSALLLVDGALFGLAVAGVLPGGALLLTVVAAIPLMLWWLYDFQDWRNDLYQVTPDQIVDVYRRPLGRETRDSASLENIQGLRSERPTWLSRILNFGNVVATIPGKEFTFDDVFDPPAVQEDIQRRIEALRVRRNQQELNRRREDLAEVLSAYYLATQEIDRGGRPAASAPADGAP